VTVSLPILDPTPTEGLPDELATVEQLREPGMPSLTHQIIERAMAADFPTVAALSLPSYVHRLSRIIYTTGFQVIWLDRLPDLPGYTLAALEPPTTQVLPDGRLGLTIDYVTGPAAARRAEEVRRWIPPGETHS
jgi:hypothetical protein